MLLPNIQSERRNNMAYAKCCEVIAKSLIANADSIVSEIDKYIAKTDDDLKNS